LISHITRYDEGRDELLQLCRQRQMSTSQPSTSA